MDVVNPSPTVTAASVNEYDETSSKIREMVTLLANRKLNEAAPFEDAKRRASLLALAKILLAVAEKSVTPVQSK